MTKLSKLKCVYLNLKINFQEHSISWRQENVYLSVAFHRSKQPETASIFFTLPDLDALDFCYSRYAIYKPED